MLLSDILDARHDVLGLLMPRRSFKTSTLFSKAMGRIASREDYYVGYTMTTLAIKARARFRDDIVKPLESLFPDPKTRPFKIVKAGGSERIEWLETGSVFAFLAPKGDAFRSDAWDWIILDEGGEAKPEMGEDILEAAPETQDTRPDPHMTMAGTGPRYRSGNLLWDALERGRAGEEGYSILDYSAEQTMTVDEVGTWAKAEKVLIGLHPTAGTVSNLSTIRRNYGLHGPAAFLREYCGVAGLAGGTSFLDMTKWAASGDDGDLPSPPDRFGLAIAVHQNLGSASIGVAWRDELGRACVGLVDRRAATGWLRDRALQLARKYKQEIVHDSMGAILVEVEQLQRARPRPRMAPQKTADVATAAALLVKELDAGNLRHWNQPDLTLAAEVAVQRQLGNTKAWGFGRPASDPDADITPLEVVSNALHHYDQMKPASKLKIVGGSRKDQAA